MLIIDGCMALTESMPKLTIQPCINHPHVLSLKSEDVNYTCIFYHSLDLQDRLCDFSVFKSTDCIEVWNIVTPVSHMVYYLGKHFPIKVLV